MLRQGGVVGWCPGLVDFRGYRTWYRVVGRLDPDALYAPVVICHGGPGATHDYVAPIAELGRSGRAWRRSASKPRSARSGSTCCIAWSAATTAGR